MKRQKGPGSTPTRRPPARRLPRRPSHSTVSARTRHTTVRAQPPLAETRPPRPARRAPTPKLAIRRPQTPAAPKRQVGRILDDDSTLLDLIDNLLEKGVMLNADLILALADVDLVYVRLSALLCAADRVLPPVRR